MKPNLKMNINTNEWTREKKNHECHWIWMKMSELVTRTISSIHSILVGHHFVLINIVHYPKKKWWIKAEIHARREWHTKSTDLKHFFSSLFLSHFTITSVVYLLVSLTSLSQARIFTLLFWHYMKCRVIASMFQSLPFLVHHQHFQ